MIIKPGEERIEIKGYRFLKKGADGGIDKDFLDGALKAGNVGLKVFYPRDEHGMEQLIRPETKHDNDDFYCLGHTYLLLNDSTLVYKPDITCSAYVNGVFSLSFKTSEKTLELCKKFQNGVVKILPPSTAKEYIHALYMEQQSRADELQKQVMEYREQINLREAELTHMITEQK